MAAEMRFTLTIAMDGAAFEDGPTLEVARILGVVAEGLGYNGHDYLADEKAVRDTNGNTVGGWKITYDEPLTYSRAEIVNGTGWKAGVRFVEVAG